MVLTTKINVLTKLFSYLLPITLKKASTPLNPKLSLELINGQVCLNASKACYSAGTQYPPLKLALQHINGYLNQVNQMLLLGAGIGSGILIYEQYHPLPQTDVVDNEQLILEWMMDLLPARLHDRIITYNEDARSFVSSSTKKYDLIISDVFSDLEMPEYISCISYLGKMKELLNDSGYIIINYIFQDEASFQSLINSLLDMQLHSEILDYHPNKIIIAKQA